MSTRWWLLEYKLPPKRKKVTLLKLDEIQHLHLSFFLNLGKRMSCTTNCIPWLIASLVFSSDKEWGVINCYYCCKPVTLKSLFHVGLGFGDDQKFPLEDCLYHDYSRAYVIYPNSKLVLWLDIIFSRNKFLFNIPTRITSRVSSICCCDW